MKIFDKLATSLGRRDEAPNIALAEEIVKKKSRNAIAELISLLHHKDKNIQSDSVKVLYEIGERNPALIEEYDKVFLTFLDHKNNRLVWGAMAALDSISRIKPKEISKKLVYILGIAAKGSVITRDHAVNILINIAKMKHYSRDAQTLLYAEMESCPINQLPMYAERAMPIITKDMAPKFKEVLQMRLDSVMPESKRKRIEKVLKKIDEVKGSCQAEAGHPLGCKTSISIVESPKFQTSGWRLSVGRSCKLRIRWVLTWYGAKFQTSPKKYFF